MSTNEKKGVTVKIDAELHAEVKQYIEAHIAPPIKACQITE